MCLVWLLGIIAIIGLISIVVRKRKGQHVDEVPTCNSNDTTYPRNGRQYLSPTASKVLDAKMDAEDKRFRGSKTWD